MERGKPQARSTWGGVLPCNINKQTKKQNKQQQQQQKKNPKKKKKK